MKGTNRPRLRPFTIEIVGRPVGGRHQHDARGEQALEQARQDHRIGDVLDLELVEAEEPHLVRRSIAATGTIGSPSEPLADDVDPLVDLVHELVEMDAALRHGVGEREELVHQHGLAAADLAVDVEPAYGAGSARAEQPADETVSRRRRLPVGRARLRASRRVDDSGLRRIAR